MVDKNPYLQFSRFTTSVLLGALLVAFARAWVTHWDGGNPFYAFADAKVCILVTAVLLLVESYVVQGVYHVTFGVDYNPAFLYFDLLIALIFASVPVVPEGAEYRIPAMMTCLLALMLLRQVWCFLEIEEKRKRLSGKLRRILVPFVGTVVVVFLCWRNLVASEGAEKLSESWSQAVMWVLIVYTFVARVAKVRESDHSEAA